MGAIEPKIMRWAREKAGMSLHEAAHALGMKGDNGRARLAAIEDGTKPPSRPLLLKMAKEYRRPLITFYLAAPPPVGDRGQDFRTLPGAERFHPDVDALVRDIKARQGLILSMLEDDDAMPVPFVGSARPGSTARTLALQIAETLGFSLQEFRAAKNVDDAFMYLRTRIESAGVFVLLVGNLGSHHSNIPVALFRGFALSDPIAPIIVINDQDAHVAWAFTAMHELVHLWFGDTGISGTDTENKVEQFCNEVAGELLLPAREVLSIQWNENSRESLLNAISAFADSRRVSRSMVAYKLARLGRLSKEAWEDVSSHFAAQWTQAKQREAEKNRAVDGGPNYYVIRRHRVGKALLSLVRRSLDEGNITYTKASRILGVKPRSVEPLLSGRGAHQITVLYLLDANVLITASNTYYPIDQIPEFQSWVLHQATLGTIKLPLEIMEEVLIGSKKGDPLIDWMNDNGPALLLDEDVVPDNVQHVIAAGYAPDLNDFELHEIGRDPFLIAYAITDPNRCVVTVETSKPAKQRQNRKIPDVCKTIGVACCGPFEVYRQLGFRTAWKI